MKNIYKALADFQQEVPVIEKASKGYNYSYTDLPTIFNVINPLLKKHGLGFTQPIMVDGIKTIVFHSESGESIESLTEIPKNVTLKGMNDFQILGSAITYLRRYALSSLLGLVTDKDVDAGGVQVVSATRVNEIKQKVDAISQKQALNGFYASLNNTEKTNKDIMQILKDKQNDLKQV